MSITTLYAELVVVGTGALLFVLLSVYAFFGASWVPAVSADSAGKVIALVPVLSVIYLLGIIVANVTHIILQKREERLRINALAKINMDVPGEKKYEQLRTELYMSPNAQNFVHDFEFRRSKVRICRGWCLNCVLLIVALLACFGNGRTSLQVTIFGCVALAFLAAGAFVSWYTATTTELQWMQSFAQQQRTKAQAAKQPLPPFIDT